MNFNGKPEDRKQKHCNPKVNVKFCFQVCFEFYQTYFTSMASTTSSPKKGFHCIECKRVVFTSRALRKHLESPHKIKQCQNTDHEHEWIDQEFESLEEGREWVQTQELDKYYTVDKSGKNYAKYQCRLNSREKRYEAKEKIRNTSDKYPRMDCSANFLLSKVLVCKCSTNIESNVCSNSREVFKLRGCIRHSHEIKAQHFRIASKTRTELVELLQAGVPKNTIIRRYCTNRPGDKIITLADLRNLERKYVNKDLLMYPKNLRDRRQRAIEIISCMKDALEGNASPEDMSTMVEAVEKFHCEFPEEMRKSVCPNIKKRKTPTTSTLRPPSQESTMSLDSCSE